MRCFEFSSLAEAEAALQIINAVMVAGAVERGYQHAPEGGIIGKNAKTAEDEPEKARTLTWSVPREQDGRWYVTVPPYEDETRLVLDKQGEIIGTEVVRKGFRAKLEELFPGTAWAEVEVQFTGAQVE